MGKTLHYITIIIIIGLIYPSLAQIYFIVTETDHRMNIAVILWFQIITAITCFLLNKKGYSVATSRILPFSFIPFQLALIASSQFNVYDVAMWTYGPIFILASSILEKRWYIIFTILQLLSITFHYTNELTRLTIPGYSLGDIWNDYFDSISINFVTAIGAYVLSANVLRSYRQANENARDAKMAKKRLDLIMETSPGGIAIFNNEGVITFANRVAKEIFELSDEPSDGSIRPALSWKLTTLIGKEIPFQEYPHIAVQRTGIQSYGHRLQLVFENGRKKILGISTAPWYNEKNEIVGSVSTFRNITEQMRTEEELTMRREQISSITENLHSVIYRVQLERGKMIKPVFISDGAKELFGYTAEELMSDIRKFMSSIYRIDAVNDIKRLRELLDDPKPFEYEYRVVNKTGEVRWQRNSGSPFVMSDGTVMVDGFVLDITAQKEVEQQLQMLGQAVNNSSEVIFMTDVNEIFIFVNPRFTELYGYSADEIVGLRTPNILENIPNEIITNKSLWEQLDQMKVVTTIFNNKSKSGKEIEVESSITPIVDRHGKLQGYLSIQRDITERRKIEDAIQQSKKMESLSILAGGVAHEFNNLLTTILGRATMHQNKMEKGTPVHTAFVKIEQSALRASELTKQLLAYSGRSKFEIRSVLLNDIIRENLTYLTMTTAKMVHLSTELSEDLLPVRADIRQMKQLIVNLAANAIEADTGNAPEIIIRTSMRTPDQATMQEWSLIPKTSLMPGEYVVLEIEDHGAGMDLEVKEKIFDPFFTTKFTGRGLGLSAVLGIVQGHRGGIVVDSTIGKGTNILIALPAYHSEHEQSAKIVTPENKKSIIFIDDEEMNLELIKDIFESEGIAVHTATSAAKGLSFLQEHQHEVAMIMLDVHIPGSSCKETVYRIREINKRVAVILTSGLPSESIEHYSEMIVDGFMKKPYSSKSLLDLYEQHSRR
ncbi:MAG: PAS domain S-box protein [Bacteroidota bacterium]